MYPNNVISSLVATVVIPVASGPVSVSTGLAIWPSYELEAFGYLYIIHLISFPLFGV